MLEKILSQKKFNPILKGNKTDFVWIDISKNNKELLQVDFSDSSDFSEYINNFLAKNNAKIGVGGYNEPRNIYKRSSNFNDNNSNERYIHLGIDLWTSANTPVYAPLSGKIHSFRNNGIGNYGPTIILEHHLQGYKFYTLYGHLTEASVDDLEIGDPITENQVLASIGNHPTNGD